MCGLVPYLLSGWQLDGGVRHGWPLRSLGIGLVTVGVGFLVSAFARFVREGAGTPAPVAPPAHLVVGGTYRHVRNPMYLAVLSVTLGQALVFGSLVLAAWAGVVLLATYLFVRRVEEPSLEGRFGAEFEAYRRAVPGWIPRLRPWDGEPSRTPRRVR